MTDKKVEHLLNAHPTLAKVPEAERLNLFYRANKHPLFWGVLIGLFTLWFYFFGAELIQLSGNLLTGEEKGRAEKYTVLLKQALYPAILPAFVFITVAFWLKKWIIKRMVKKEYPNPLQGVTFGSLKAVDEGLVFDKAKYHLETVLEEHLNELQAYVYTGLFFAWIIKNDLYSSFLLQESAEEIEQINNETVSPCSLYIHWDGVLVGEFLSQVGFNFTDDYFDFDHGDYMNDYLVTLADNDPDMYRVEDSWDNYHKIAKVIDKSFSQWLKSHSDA